MSDDFDKNTRIMAKNAIATAATSPQFKQLPRDTSAIVLVIADLAAAIREQNALLAQATHPNRCPCEACRGKP